MKILETDRLVLRHLSADDAAFIVELVNDPGWLRFIGDKGVRTLDDARAYIENGMVASYARHGFGLYLTELKEGSVPIGICGLIRRDGLEDVDVGFAFLPGFRGQGYAHESAAAVMAHGRETLGIGRIVAITTQDNHASMKLLEKLGMRFERLITLPGDPVELTLFASDG